MQQPHGIDKTVTVFFLIAKAIQGDHLATQRAIGQSRQKVGPTP